MPSKQQSLFDFTSDLDVAVGPSGLAPELYRELTERRTQFIGKLASGNCKTMESVADAVGNIRCAEFVLSFADRKRRALEAELGTPIDGDDA